MKTKNTIEKGIDSVLAPVHIYNTTDLFKESLSIDSDKSRAVVRENKVLGFVSPNFSVIKPMDFHLEMTQMFEKSGINPEPWGRIDDRGNWEIRYQVNGKKFDKGQNKVGDEINPFVSFSNGLAGTKSGGASGGAFRLVCTNGASSNVTKEIFERKVRNTKNSQNLKFGIDFDLLLQKYLEFFESFDQVLEEQRKFQEIEFQKELVLPVFMELTKGTKFPVSKFQAAFDRIAVEAKELGYTQMNSYLAYNGLNYILEHDSLQLDINQVKETDATIMKRLATLDFNQAQINFNEIVQKEKEKIQAYRNENDGKDPRGKRKVLELDLSAF